ncbi:MAG: putative bifunctional diguanylate cyclase/phosphodiesterase [Acidimicrobiales bacterium]
MKSSTTGNTGRSREETRLVFETLMQIIPGAAVVAVVGTGTTANFEADPLVARDANDAFEYLRDLVSSQLRDAKLVSTFTCQIGGAEWGVVSESLEAGDGRVRSVLVVARQGRTWSKRERSLVRAFAGLLGHVATQVTRETSLLHQRRLDELVAQVAERLMSATIATRQETLNWTVRVLGEFLGSDAAFLRRNDLARGLSILEAEWPARENVPDPDPLGEVAFEVDPIFAAMKDLRTPFMPGVEEVTEDYLKRVESGSGVPEVAGAAVPLLLDDSTWGILGFIHFGLHAWVPSEINALQAVASMLVQLQGRFDAEARTVYNATHDDLTGLPNRRALVRELTERIESGRETAVMVIDLDRFKVMNDFLGHASGDRLLVTIADRLRTSVRTNDFAGRLGGDEFVVLADAVSSELDLLASAYRLLGVISEPTAVGGQRLTHTASIGVAAVGTGAPNALDVIGWADVAMYAAKARGGHQVVVFDDELRQSASTRSNLELQLRDAIENGDLRLHFQPEVDLRTGRLLAVESLVRWQHPTRGLVDANDFIKVAEETGLIVDIGRWVFAQACRQLAEWEREYPDLDFVVRVNMSPAEFVMGDIVEFVEGCLTSNGVEGGRICIEITEHVVLTESERTAGILRRFQALGVEVALDDFGTGFASMTELKNLPVDFLKLDMSFVRGVTTDAYDRAIVESIIRLAAALHLGVIAEGVESIEILDKLVELGCTRGQGYLMSRAVPSGELALLLARGGVDAALLRVDSSRLADFPS